MMKDSIQIISANAGAIGISLANVNDVLTLVSLTLAICYTVWKFLKLDNKNG